MAWVMPKHVFKKLHRELKISVDILLFSIQQKICNGCRLENWVFCIRYFSKRRSKPAGKNTGWCFAIQLKTTCKNSGTCEEKRKNTKLSLNNLLQSPLQLSSVRLWSTQCVILFAKAVETLIHGNLGYIVFLIVCTIIIFSFGFIKALIQREY